MLEKVNIKALTDSAVKVLKKRSPEILTGIGITGMIMTTVLAVKATPKAMMLIEERKLDLQTDKITKVEAVKTVWPCYILPVITGAASIACLVGASSVNARRNAALATAYALSETAFKEYQDQVVESIGTKKSSEIRDELAKKKLDRDPVATNEIVVTDKGETLCYEPLSGRYFRSDIDKIKRALNEVNNMLLKDEHIVLNDFYCEIGLGETKIGDDLGWHIQAGLVDIHFSTHLAANGEPCLVIDFVTPPTYDYDKWM